MRMNHILILLAFVFCVTTIVNAQQWDKEIVPKLILKDKKIINTLLEELFIIDTVVTRIELYDINNDGIGEGDVLKIIPGQKTYLLNLVSPGIQNVLHKFTQPEVVEKSGSTKTMTYPEIAEEKLVHRFI